MNRIEYTQPTNQVWNIASESGGNLSPDQIKSIWRQKQQSQLWDPLADREPTKFLEAAGCFPCYPWTLAGRHRVAACQASGTVEKIKHATWACLECLPGINCCVAPLDRKRNVQNAFDAVSEYIKHPVPEFPFPINKKVPRLMTIDGQMTHPIMMGKDEQGKRVILIKRPHETHVQFPFANQSYPALREEGETLELFFEDGLTLFIAPPGIYTEYDTNREKIRYLSAKDTVFLLSPGLEGFLLNHDPTTRLEVREALAYTDPSITNI